MVRVRVRGRSASVPAVADGRCTVAPAACEVAAAVTASCSCTPGDLPGELRSATATSGCRAPRDIAPAPGELPHVTPRRPPQTPSATWLGVEGSRQAHATVCPRAAGSSLACSDSAPWTTICLGPLGGGMKSSICRHRDKAHSLSLMCLWRRKRSWCEINNGDVTAVGL